MNCFESGLRYFQRTSIRTEERRSYTHTKRNKSNPGSNVCNPGIQKAKEFEASLSYMRPYFKKFEGWRDGSVDEDGLLPNLII